MSHDLTTPDFSPLVAFLERVPAIRAPSPLESGGAGGAAESWRFSFAVTPTYPFAWRVVQEFAYSLNSDRNDHRPHTAFWPVSPAAESCGGPGLALRWVIECSHEATPAELAQLLESKFPQPADDVRRWYLEE
jgi:hypothetical protein